MSVEKGKIPPQAINLEEAVIGAMLLGANGVDAALGVISSSEVFYKESHQFVFEAIKALDKDNDSVDLLTVSQRLKKMGKLEAVGGDFFLINLTQKVASSAHVEYHARVVLQKYMARQLIALGNKAVENGYDETRDVFESLDDISIMFDAVAGIYQKGGMGMDWATAMDEVPKRVERLTNNKGELTGVDTGLDNMNVFFNGWQPTDFIVIGADSGMGKTALAMAHILASAKKGDAVGMFSMEMSTIQLAIRATAVESNYHMKQLTRYGFEKHEYFERLSVVVNNLRGLPIIIDDRPNLTVPEMKRRARQMMRKEKIKLLIVDFVQMFQGDDDDIKTTGIAARELKNLAKELNIPVIALSQLNREVKKAKYNIPEKHHLKNSSGIEEAADIIALLYRPGYYGFNQNSNPDLWNDLDLKGDENAVLIIKKNRNGALGVLPMRYLEDKTKYVNPSIFQSNVEHEDIFI